MILLFPGAVSAQIQKTTFVGGPGNTPVIGDWNGDGKTEIGISNGMTWYLDYNGNSVLNTGTDKTYSFGASGWTPVTGDWNGDGKAEAGIYQNGIWYLDYNGNGVWNAGIDKIYSFGATGWTPVVGDWNGDGKTEAGVYRNGVFNLDSNGNGIRNDANVDKVVNFGITGYTPVAGDWNGDRKTTVGLTNGNSWYLDMNGEAAPSSSASSITLTSPNGGESWKRGTSNMVTWSYAGSPGSSVKIVLMKAGTEVGTIVASAPLGSGGKGSYTWPISSAGVTGSDFRVSIQSSSQPAIKDISNNYFTVTSATVNPAAATTPAASSIKSISPAATTTPAASTINSLPPAGSSTLYLDQYGIKGDGTDETTKLQTALNYAASHAVKTVVFPKSKIIGLKSNSIRFPDGITYNGNGCTLKRLDKVDSDVFLKFGAASGGSGLEAYGFIIDCNTMLVWSGGDGVILNSNVYFHDNEVKNAREYTISCYGSKNVRIVNNIVHDNYQYGICTGGGDAGGVTHNIQVIGNTVYNNGEVGIKIRGTHDSVISGNKVTMAVFAGSHTDTQRGIALYSFDYPNDNIQIINNRISGEGDAISQDDNRNTNIKISGNIIS